MSWGNEDAELDKFTGCKVNIEKFKDFFVINGGGDFVCKSGEEYICYFVDLLNTPKEALVGITKTLKSRWEYRGIDFRLTVYFNDDSKIESASVDKFTEDDHGHFKAVITELSPTKQEIRIAMRLLDMCLKKEIE